MSTARRTFVDDPAPDPFGIRWRRMYFDGWLYQVVCRDCGLDATHHMAETEAGVGMRACTPTPQEATTG